MNSVTAPALDALNDLVQSARSNADEAAALDRPHNAATLTSMATTLDGARTRLIEDGPDYLPAAWAFVDAARSLIARQAVILDRARAERAYLAEIGLYR